jgi:hypothetical protein
MEFRRVLQIIKSAHCTITMVTKKAVWQVYSSSFLSRYVCERKRLGYNELMFQQI